MKKLLFFAALITISANCFAMENETKQESLFPTWDLLLKDTKYCKKLISELHAALFPQKKQYKRVFFNLFKKRISVEEKLGDIINRIKEEQQNITNEKEKNLYQNKITDLLNIQYDLLNPLSLQRNKKNLGGTQVATFILNIKDLEKLINHENKNRNSKY